ncbi:MAG: hypothetical protein COT74_08755 [Bdellovibrionales bacterium CG10_big_fil_rev_8_21_14_0_10_45_34]|nr:MAG: hypothetical protein COT74_08755 [Bdellovibrionales bacterium CG10_big_fil_rev_8_21_14_0_10_45_34]
MEIFRGVHTLNRPLPGSVVTIGNFDGVHLGHQKIVSDLQDMARRLGLTTVVFSFSPHPRRVLFPQLDFKCLSTEKEQLARFEELGVDKVVIEPFSRAVSQLSPQRFFNEWILKPLAAQGLVVGYDFSFGANREGNFEILQSLCECAGVELRTTSALRIAGEIVSSSRIRKLLLESQVEKAALLLGRPFSIVGLVKKGDGRGKSLGFPTANLEVEGEFLPRSGVYFGKAKWQGRSDWAIANIGSRPTFYSDGQVQPEVHILEQDVNLYGTSLEFEFHAHLRSEKKFAGPNELIEQIKIDVQQARNHIQ